MRLFFFAFIGMLETFYNIAKIDPVLSDVLCSSLHTRAFTPPGLQLPRISFRLGLFAVMCLPNLLFDAAQAS